MPLLSVLVVTTLVATPRLAIPELNGAPELQSLASAIGGIIANEAARTNAFEVQAASQVAALLSLERQRQLFGEEQGNSAALVAMLNVDYLLTGRLTRLKDGPLTLELTLLDVAKAKRVGSATTTSPTEAMLVTAIAPLVARVFSAVLAKQSGFIAVTSSEKGAVVKVDDSAMGTTPLPGKVSAASGVRFITLEKQGFTSWRQEVVVRASQVSEVQARLVPSPDFIAEYEAKQTRLRVGAISTTALSVLGVAAGAVLVWRAQTLYGSPTAPGTFMYYREHLTTGTEADETNRAAAEALKPTIELYRNLSIVSFAVAAASAVAATVFWVMTDDADKYAPFREVKVGLGVAPTSGGAAFALTGSF